MPLIKYFKHKHFPIKLAFITIFVALPFIGFLVGYTLNQPKIVVSPTDPTITPNTSATVNRAKTKDNNINSGNIYQNSEYKITFPALSSDSTGISDGTFVVNEKQYEEGFPYTEIVYSFKDNGTKRELSIILTNSKTYKQQTVEELLKENGIGEIVTVGDYKAIYVEGDVETALGSYQILYKGNGYTFSFSIPVENYSNSQSISYESYNQIISSIMNSLEFTY